MNEQPDQPMNFLDLKPGDLVLTDASDEWATVTKIHITGAELRIGGEIRPAYNDPHHFWAPPGGVKIIGHRAPMRLAE